jgi:selenocysteine-specific elongation factor
MIQTYMIDVRLHLLETTERTVRNNSRVHFYYGSDECIGKVILLDEEELLPGETAYAQIRFDQQIALKRQDYFVIRFYSPMETIGGGVVLDASPKRHKRNIDAVLESCRIKDEGTDLAIMEQFLQECSSCFPDSHLLSLKTRFPAPLTSSLLNQLKGKGIALEISKQVFIHQSFYEKYSEIVLNWLNQFHKDNALSEGMSKEEIKSRMKQNFYDASEKNLDAFYDYLISKKVIKENNGLTSAYNFKLKHNDDHQKELQELIEQYKACGYQMPKADDIIKNSKNPKTTKQLLEQLLKDGELIKVTPPYYIHKDAWNQALHLLVDHIEAHGSITLADYRSLLDSSRKYTQMLLECYDSKRITKMKDDARTLIKNPFA